MSANNKDVLVFKGSNAKISLEKLVSEISTRYFIHFYDAADVAQDNEITSLDLGVTSLLGAPIGRGKALVNLYDNGEAKWRLINSLLGKVSAEWKLADHGAGTYKESVTRLLAELLRVDGIGPAIATKLLHKKRPTLIPIVDSVILEFYECRRKLPEHVSEVVFGPFRDDLRNNAASLAKIKDALESQPETPKLSNVRIMELAIWIQSRNAGA